MDQTRGGSPSLCCTLMDLEHSPRHEGIFARRFLLCERLARDFSLGELITQSTCCDTYFVACCYHRTFKGDLFPCHNFRLIFIEGACSNNGQVVATAGIWIGMEGCERD
ncbi:uncharacterized protein EV420DRAFT_578377 [Desarmillaria tabescens]|uniref:Uncharacterized protein n=1 Tax=Armillaria tabescens TaxID=1929756 RepID=A0AA39K946_ARMTA|nr:uncharacterized protein EV420DRAFT_578377 [Desarmillaria tabescens]KAK0455576.1 hypothetical protein EV420DRAFT_578377 [Desarmillaria tabescens]